MNLNPTSTPLASTAMEAAREIDREADFGGKLTPANAVTEIAAIIQKHFQPLLAKVEGERDARQRDLDKRLEDYLNERVCCTGDNCGCMGSTRIQELIAQEAFASITALRADLAAAKEDADKVRKDMQFIQQIAYEVCRCDDDPHGDMLTIEGVARGVLGMPPDDGFEATPIRITAAQFTEMLRAYGWADNKESLQMFLHRLRADLAAKEAEKTKYRTALVICHAHLCKEIQALSLNESAKAGSQSLLHEISVLLDSSALASRADKGGAT